MSNQALRGIKVLDLSENLPGPYTALILAALGATVTKVERPSGDPAKRLPRLYDALNRGKKVVHADLKTEVGVTDVKRLINVSDVVIESFRPGTLQRLGIDFEALKRENPQTVFVSITGYGQTGGWAQRPAHDLNLQALSGFSYLERKSKKLMGKTVLPIADLSASFWAVIQILAALLKRHETQQGDHIDIAMVDALYHWVQLWSVGTHPDQWDEENQKGKLKKLVQGSIERLRLYALPHYDIFAAKDGPLALGVVMEKKFWRVLVAQAGRNFMTDFSVPMRIVSRQLVRQVVGRRLGQKTVSEWIALMADELPVSPVLTPSDARTHEAMANRPGVATGWTGVPLEPRLEK